MICLSIFQKWSMDILSLSKGFYPTQTVFVVKESTVLYSTVPEGLGGQGGFPAAQAVVNSSWIQQEQVTGNRKEYKRYVMFVHMFLDFRDF